MADYFTRDLAAADPELWHRTGTAVPVDQRFREHEGDDYPMTDEDRRFRALWWRVGIALTAAVWGAVVLAVWPN